MMRSLALAPLLILGGCVSVLPEGRPAAPRYLLEAATYEAGVTSDILWSLIVEDPGATRVYDSPRIALVREAGRVEYLGNGEWADRAPRLLQSALVRSFENTGRILAVGDRTTLPAGNFILQTDIRALHASLAGEAPAAILSIHARLLNPRGKVFAVRLFERSEPMPSGTPVEIGAAFDRAVSATLREVVAWTFEEGEKAYAK